MDSYKFERACKEWVKNYYKAAFGIDILAEDVYTVWQCRILQNNKILVSTTVEDGLYIECTRNGDKEETYFDVYKRQVNIPKADFELWG